MSVASTSITGLPYTLVGSSFLTAPYLYTQYVQQTQAVAEASYQQTVDNPGTVITSSATVKISKAESSTGAVGDESSGGGVFMDSATAIADGSVTPKYTPQVYFGDNGVGTIRMGGMQDTAGIPTEMKLSIEMKKTSVTGLEWSKFGVFTAETPPDPFVI